MSTLDHEKHFKEKKDKSSVVKAFKILVITSLDIAFIGIHGPAEEIERKIAAGQT